MAQDCIGEASFVGDSMLELADFGSAIGPRRVRMRTCRRGLKHRLVPMDEIASSQEGKARKDKGDET
jgi:hypothetical protein